MKIFDIQGVVLDVPRPRAFAYIADRKRLPEWTSAFASVSASNALRTRYQLQRNCALPG